MTMPSDVDPITRDDCDDPPACGTCGEACGDDAVVQADRHYCDEECRPLVRADFRARGPCRTCRGQWNCYGGECWDCFSDRLETPVAGCPGSV